MLRGCHEETAPVEFTLNTRAVLYSPRLAPTALSACGCRSRRVRMELSATAASLVDYLLSL